jgi:hypothetical protein
MVLLWYLRLLPYHAEDRGQIPLDAGVARECAVNASGQSESSA